LKNRFIQYTVILIFCLSANVCSSQDFKSNKLMPCAGENQHFDNGEKLTYTIYYNWGLLWISAGEVTFEVKEEGDQYHYITTGATYKRYDKIFKVRDYFESKVDKSTLLPTSFKREVEEGKYIRFDSISFDQSAFSVEEYFGRSKSKAKKYNFELEHCSHDLLSIIYFLRNIDIEALSVEDRLPMDVFFDKELFSLDLKYSEYIEDKKIKELGKHDVRVFQPTLITGNVFTEEAVMNIYISDDKNRIPLLIESPVSVGSVKAVLSDHSGLKYPLDIE